MDSTQEALNYLQERYGTATADTTARALLLKWFKQAAAEFWNAEDWWWKRQKADFTITEAVSEYTLDTGVESVLTLANGDLDPMNYVDARTFQHLYRPNAATTGTPDTWTFTERDQTSGALKIEMWPTPDATATGQIVQKVRDVTLSDSGSNKSRIPKEWIHCVINRALSIMADYEKQPTEMQAHETKYQQALAACVAENERRKKGESR